MKYTITAIVVFALLASAHADESHLTDATGKKYDPFEFKQSETLSIAGQKYTISKKLTKEQQKILEKMKTIIIPEIDFRQANVNDVISFLQKASVEFEPKSKRQRGVSFILNLGSPSDVPLITFSARHISLFDTMNIICKICDLNWSKSKL